jgi:hypothetical protein
MLIVRSPACRARWVAFLLFGLCAHPAWSQAKPPDAPRPVQIDRNAVLILIRTTLLAVDQANRTGNYTVLRDLGAPAFQQANTSARLAEIFANLRGQNLDLSGAAVLDPQLTLLPQIEPNGLMHMTGFFPSIPLQINFDLLYAAIDGRWRPFGISVGVSQSAPVAPGGPAPVAEAPPTPSTTRPAALDRPGAPARAHRAPARPTSPPREAGADRAQQ